jgi:hypothetical protein
MTNRLSRAMQKESFKMTNISIGEIWKWDHVIFVITSIQNDHLTLLVLNSDEWSFLNSGSVLSYWKITNLEMCCRLIDNL